MLDTLPRRCPLTQFKLRTTTLLMLCLQLVFLNSEFSFSHFDLSVSLILCFCAAFRALSCVFFINWLQYLSLYFFCYVHSSFIFLRILSSHFFYFISSSVSPILILVFRSFFLRHLSSLMWLFHFRVQFLSFWSWCFVHSSLFDLVFFPIHVFQFWVQFLSLLGYVVFHVFCAIRLCKQPFEMSSIFFLYFEFNILYFWSM